jgi:hypothetical protein
MSTAVMTERILETSPSLKARIVGVFYLLCFVTGIAAFISLVGCAMGPLSLFHLVPVHINSLVFFGFYCLLIGYLTIRSTFLPRILGVLMMIAGVGWSTFLSPTLANHLSPYIFVPGILGDGALTLWLLAMGLNAGRWNEQAGVIGRRV